jgi:AraC-like DNA-binding protein
VMFLTFEDRPSTSRYIERVWRCHSTTGGVFYSMAEGNLELVVTRLEGWALVTLRGPVTQAAPITCPPNGRWLGIRFRVGTYFRSFATAALLNHRDLNFATTSDGRFWFDGEMWPVPDFENAEIFVGRLAKQGAIGMEPAVQAAVLGDHQTLSRRSVQRRFLRVTGMTYAQLRQIERARHAVQLLHGGSSILDAVHASGYFDQAHLSRSLKRLVGLTPTTILRHEAQLSFSYKTESLKRA